MNQRHSQAGRSHSTGCSHWSPPLQVGFGESSHLAGGSPFSEEWRICHSQLECPGLRHPTLLPPPCLNLIIPEEILCFVGVARQHSAGAGAPTKGRAALSFQTTVPRGALTLETGGRGWLTAAISSSLPFHWCPLPGLCAPQGHALRADTLSPGSLSTTKGCAEEMAQHSSPPAWRRFAPC